MWLAFLSALLDPIVGATALLFVFLARSAMQLRVIVAGVASTLSLSELLGGFHEPLTAVLASAGGAALGGLLLAETSRLVVAPIAAGALALVLAAMGWFRKRQDT